MYSVSSIKREIQRVEIKKNSLAKSPVKFIDFAEPQHPHGKTKAAAVTVIRAADRSILPVAL